MHGKAGAYCNFHEKKIVCDSLEYSDLSKTETDRLLKQYLRHEILHAFLFESGLGFDSISNAGAWATNEEIVDWFAIQSPFQSTLPVGGSDVACFHVKMDLSVFQSTLPAGDRPSISTALSTTTHFNPRSPRGSDSIGCKKIF